MFDFFVKNRKTAKKEHPKMKDVIFAPKKEIIRLKEKVWRLEISEKKIINFIIANKRGLLVGGIICFIFIFSVYSFLATQAETVYFYPETALGGWENYQNAQGVPEMGEYPDPASFDVNNSAVLRNMASQIFLGNFQGDLPSEAQLQRAVLKISWAIKEKVEAQPIDNVININEEFPIVTPSPEIDLTPTPSPTEEVILDPTPSREPIFVPGVPLEESPTPTPEPTLEFIPTPIIELIPEDTPISWWHKLITKVLAQEISLTPIIIEEILPPTDGLTPTPTPIIEPTIEPAPILESTPTPTSEATIEPTIESTPEIIQEPPMESIIPEITPEITPEPTMAPAEDLIEVTYSLDGMIWNVLTRVNRENWENLTLEIPNFQAVDLQNLQISFQSLPVIDQNWEIYLDGVSLEIEYELISTPEPSPEATSMEIKQEEELVFFNHAEQFDTNSEPELFLAKPLSGSWMEKAQIFFQEPTQVQGAKLISEDGQEISVHLVFQEEDDYRIRIRKPENLTEGQYYFEIKLKKYDTIYNAKTSFLWKKVYVPQKTLSFSLAGAAITTNKILEWHPKAWQSLKNTQNVSMGINLQKFQENGVMPESSEIVLSGVCRDTYFVVLAYTRADDYIKNPGGAILNKALPCQNGHYYYKIDGTSANFESSIYYLLIAEEDESNPWQPISALQPIQVKVEYK